MLHNSNDSKQLALAAVMFFALMVKGLVEKNNDLTTEEKTFVQSYIQYGYITMISGIITLIMVIVYYFFPSILVYRIHMISIVATISLLVVGSIWVVSWTVIIQGENKQYNKIQHDVAEVILYYIPLYNIYARYKAHTFQEPNMRIKESILRWTARTCITLALQSNILSVCILLCISIRIATIAAGIDIIGKKTKDIINKIFSVNPEEIRWYIMASIDFLQQKAQNKMIQPSRNELLHGYKKIYSHISPMQKNLRIQYSIGIIISAIIIRYYGNTITVYLPIALIYGRYITMYIRRKYLPPLPLAREIQVTIENIREKIKR